MKFQVNGSTYQLQGKLQSQTSMVSCKAMTRLLRKEKEAMMIQILLVVRFNVVEAVHL